MVGVDFCYTCYLLDSIEGKLLKLFTHGTCDISSREPNYNQILVFQNSDEKSSFEQYLNQHFYDYDDSIIDNKYQYQIAEDCPGNGGGLSYSALMVAKAAMIYEDWKKRE